MTQEPLPLFDAPDCDGQAARRDLKLDLLRRHRRRAVSVCAGVAVKLAKRHGQVTSADVLRHVRGDRELSPAILGLDARFMGAVFRGKGWTLVGHSNCGSHRRLSSVWAWSGE